MYCESPRMIWFIADICAYAGNRVLSNSVTNGYWLFVAMTVACALTIWASRSWTGLVAPDVSMIAGVATAGGAAAAAIAGDVVNATANTPAAVAVAADRAL